MQEIWANIEGFEGLYQVSNLGRVKSLKLRNGWGSFNIERILTSTDNGHGYLVVHLTRDKKMSPRYVHRLVAEAFCEKRAGCAYINHIDFDTKNNVSTNLEWCTQRENVAYSAERMRKPKKKSKPTETGEKGIYKRGDRYRVVVHKKEYPTQATLEAAIAFRDQIMAEAKWA